ncbi:Fe-binding Fe/S cluster assembly protein [Saccharomycopsis crataegensis]|uniref:Iron-sulfur assembly protein 1 n=1 Tax=Saccharomycopsis crataegensis TaxID=43959 RepID=A0AAV5QRC2_9ASCO|nr:Fe-binding Fe/S cluster assembly protein [Saccharomycopsis crataegensis]
MFKNYSSLIRKLGSIEQKRLLSDSTKGSKRYIQTINQAPTSSTFSYVPLKSNPSSVEQNSASQWNRHTLASGTRKSLNKAANSPDLGGNKSAKDNSGSNMIGRKLGNSLSKRAANSTLTSGNTPSASSTDIKPKPRRRQLKPRKSLITCTSGARERLRDLFNQPNPQYIKVGVKNRGCSGLSYHLEYVSKPEKFDEIVKLGDDLMIIIDSKALFSIIGSEMDYVEDKLSSRFVFNNPNSKGSCGCGESFMV